MMKMKKAVVAAVGAAFALTGCATANRISKEVNSSYKETENRIEQLKSSRAVAQNKGAVYSDAPYVNVRPVRRESDLPAIFNHSRVFNQTSPISINQFFAKLSATTGMRVTYDTDIVEGVGKTGAIGGVRSGGAPAVQKIVDATGTAVALPPPPGGVSLPGMMQGAPVTQDTVTTLQLSFVGTVKDMLDAVGATIGARWKYDPTTREIRFSRYVTQTFRIAMVPGNVGSKTEIQGQSGSSGSSNGPALAATATSTFEANTNPWKAVEDGVQNILSGNGSFSLSESTGMLTVRDRWDRVEEVEKLIKKINATFSRQVDITVQVYRVQDNDMDSHGINWNIFFNKLADGMGNTVAITTPRNLTAGLASAIVGMKDFVGSVLVPGYNEDGSPMLGEDGKPIMVQQKVPYKWGGSEVIIDALSEVGKASIMTTASAQTVNNQPAPIKVTRKIGYLKSIEQTNTAEVGSSTSLTPGEIEVGYNFSLLPHVQDDGKRILLQMMMSSSDLDGIDEYGTKDQKIQLPRVSAREFMQRVWLNSGESLIIAGFESSSGKDSQSSPLDATIWPIAGTRHLESKKDSIVIVVTPTVTENNAKI